MVRKVISAKRRRALRETQRKWTQKLKRVRLDDFVQVCTFADGGFSHVSLVQLAGHPDSAFALKTMQKAKIVSQSARQRVMMEKEVLSKTKSDFIVKLYKTFKDKKYLYFLTEYCPGGTLYDLDPLSEDEARFYVACLVEALDHLHSRNIVHNDLKPENLVLDAEGYVKLIDMGFAMELSRSKPVYSGIGTVEFLPPEVIRSRVDPTQRPCRRGREVDLWALGVILYELVKGKSPFEDEDPDNEVNNIIRGIDSLHFSKDCFSDEAEDLIRKLCSYDPSSRLGYDSIDEIRQHRWFDNFDWDGLRKRELRPPRRPAVRSAVDTSNFVSDFEVTPDSDVKEDESDWDLDF